MFGELPLQVFDGGFHAVDGIFVFACGTGCKKAVGKVAGQIGALKGEFGEGSVHFFARGVELVDELLARATVAEMAIGELRGVALFGCGITRHDEPFGFGSQSAQCTNAGLGKNGIPIAHVVKLPAQDRTAKFTEGFIFEKRSAELFAGGSVGVFIDDVRDASGELIEGLVGFVDDGLSLDYFIENGDFFEENRLPFGAMGLEDCEVCVGQGVIGALIGGVLNFAQEREESERVFEDASTHGPLRYTGSIKKGKLCGDEFVLFGGRGALTWGKRRGTRARMTSPVDTNALLFPAFIYGDHPSCRRKMKAEAKKWGKRYDAHGDFREPKLIPVPPGSMIFMGSQNEIALVNMGLGIETTPRPTPQVTTMYEFGSRPNPKQERWYFYLLNSLLCEMLDAFKYEYSERPVIDADFEAFMCRYPWGALSLAINRPLYNTIAAVSQRLEGVLSWWEKLDTVRYVTISSSFGTLTNLMRFHGEGPIAMWVDAPTGDVRMDLRAAIDTMRRASADEIHARILRRLHALAPIEQELPHRKWVMSPGVIEGELEHLRSADRIWYDNVTAGVYGSHVHMLHRLSDKCPDAQEASS